MFILPSFLEGNVQSSKKNKSQSKVCVIILYHCLTIKLPIALLCQYHHGWIEKWVLGMVDHQLSAGTSDRNSAMTRCGTLALLIIICRPWSIV